MSICMADGPPLQPICEVSELEVYLGVLRMEGGNRFFFCLVFLSALCLSSMGFSMESLRRKSDGRFDVVLLELFLFSAVFFLSAFLVLTSKCKVSTAPCGTWRSRLATSLTDSGHGWPLTE